MAEEIKETIETFIGTIKDIDKEFYKDNKATGVGVVKNDNSRTVVFFWYKMQEKYSDLIQIDNKLLFQNVTKSFNKKMNADVYAVRSNSHVALIKDNENVQTLLSKENNNNTHQVDSEINIDAEIAAYEKEIVSVSSVSSVSAAATLATPTNITKINQNNIIELNYNNVKKYFDTKGLCSEQEIMLFIVICKTYNLNPFLKEIFLTKSPSKSASYIVSKDLYMKRAERMPDFLGIDAGIYVMDENVTQQRKGSFYNKKSEMLLGGWANLIRKNRPDHFCSVPLDEYIKNIDSWVKMPGTMIRKVAIVQCLREAYPNYFSQLYDASEMGIEIDE